MPYLNFNNDSIRCYTLKPKDLEVFKFEISELESIFNNNDLFKTFHCINCNAELDINNIVAINDHELYCKKCSNEIFVTCSCGRIEHKDNLKYVEDVGKSMCRNCFSNYRIRECNYCKKFFKNYNRVELIGVACNKCYDDHKCFSCCSCGRSFDQERYGRDNICITCANNKVENCLNYTFKPRPNFCKMPDEYNEYDLFYGIELEMGDAPSYNDVIKFISDNMGGLFYAKRDASIPAYGCEVVTHPATLKFHLESGNWDFLLKNAQKYNLVLIDTPGVNPFKKEEVDKLKPFINVLKADKIMTMDAGRNAYDAVEIAEVFKNIGAQHIFPTRLDLARRIGGIISVADVCKLKLGAAGISASIVQGIAKIDAASLAKLLLPKHKQEGK